MVTRVGVIGYSAGNGHPFSFSAIINGYSEKDFLCSGWPIINSDLKKREAEEIERSPPVVGDRNRDLEIEQIGPSE